MKLWGGGWVDCLDCFLKPEIRENVGAFYRLARQDGYKKAKKGRNKSIVPDNRPLDNIFVRIVWSRWMDNEESGKGRAVGWDVKIDCFLSHRDNRRTMRPANSGEWNKSCTEKDAEKKKKGLKEENPEPGTWHFLKE